MQTMRSAVMVRLLGGGCDAKTWRRRRAAARPVRPRGATEDDGDQQDAEQQLPRLLQLLAELVLAELDREHADERREAGCPGPPTASQISAWTEKTTPAVSADMKPEAPT